MRIEEKEDRERRGYIVVEHNGYDAVMTPDGNLVEHPGLNRNPRANDVKMYAQFLQKLARRMTRCYNEHDAKDF